MSLTSRKSIQRAGPDWQEEYSVTFRRERDKSYTKITKAMSRDHKSGVVKSLKAHKPIEEGPYYLVKEGVHYDEKIEYDDFDGSKTAMYFKLGSAS